MLNILWRAGTTAVFALDVVLALVLAFARGGLLFFAVAMSRITD